MTPETLLKYGYRPIVSEKQAHQLLRRELKHHANWQQRDPDLRWDYRTLLRIKKGNWYTFVRNRTNGFHSILIWQVTDGH